jgi:predicted ATPase with chaperone activity
MRSIPAYNQANPHILRNCMTRTIAHLGGSEQIGCDHLVEAISYRSLDRKLWAR